MSQNIVLFLVTAVTEPIIFVTIARAHFERNTPGRDHRLHTHFASLPEGGHYMKRKYFTCKSQTGTCMPGQSCEKNG
jgi:hypothetical protein